MKDDFRIIFFITLAVLFGIYCFIFGKSGYLERLGINENRNYLLMQNKKIENEIKQLSNTLIYHKDKIIHEEAVSVGYIKDGEKLIRFEGFNRDEKKSRSEVAEQKNAHLDNLRIIWGIFSFVVLLAIVLFNGKKESGNKEVNL